MTAKTTAKKIGYSYVRFSCEGQSRGDSLRRQTELAEHYASEHDIAPTGATYHDLGLSAWHAKNAETGALGAFIEACKSGKIAPGSALIVESLDRISRDDPRKASKLLNEIVDLGVEVHTIDNGHVYRPGATFS
jgi:DNA invertase Pin-like site-specific DNA recombinase